MAQDIKVRNIQVEEIQSTAPQPISGDVFIPVNAKLRYTQAFNLDNDFDLVYVEWLNGKTGRLPIDFTSDSSGEFDFTSEDLPEYPGVTLYENGQTIPATFDNSTKKLIFLNPSTSYTVKFS
jgi:hypothetical protein